MAKTNNKKSLFEKLRYKYKLIVINEDTFEQKASLRLSRFNIYTLGGALFILMIGITTAIIAFTPIKYYMPGVGTVDVRGKLIQLELLTDSINDAMSRQSLWLTNFRNLLTDELDEMYYVSDTSRELSVVNIDLTTVSPEELILREKMEGEEMLLIMSGKRISQEESERMKLIPPVSGYVIQRYSLNKNHYGIDIAGSRDEPVKSVYEGVVIVADWNPETGHVIGVQHTNGMVSFYKHNASLLKKVGSFVRRGEAIAIIGNSGEFTTGPHLHFELWQDGKSLNPLEYINLEQIN
jgi:hypothetical protein